MTNSLQLFNFSNQQQFSIAGDVAAAEVSHDLPLAEAAEFVARRVTLCLGRRHLYKPLNVLLLLHSRWLLAPIPLGW